MIHTIDDDQIDCSNCGCLFYADEHPERCPECGEPYAALPQE
jgi:rubrerythrin